MTITKIHTHRSRNGFVNCQSKRKAFWMWKDETHQREIHVPAGRYHEPRSMVANSRYEEHADGLTQTLSQQVPKNMLTTLISKLTEPPHENVSINMIQKERPEAFRRSLMDAQQENECRKSTPGAQGSVGSQVLGTSTKKYRDTSQIFDIRKTRLCRSWWLAWKGW